MNKQEEIREGIYKQIRSDVVGHSRTDYLVDGIVNYLHSQGVVIRVDRYFPKKDAGQDNIQYCAGWYDAFHRAIDAGYVATEPLVEE